MSEPEYLGNSELLERPIIGFFGSRTTAPLSVLPTLDWARQTARRTDIAVMSGFQSPIEREALAVLLAGKCGIIAVLNRSIYRSAPPQYASAFAEGRVLFVSLVPGRVTRPSIAQAEQRNQHIATAACQLVFFSLTPSSSLYPLCQRFQTAKPTLRL